LVLVTVLAIDCLWQPATGTSVLRGFPPVSGRFMGSLRHPADVSMLAILLPLGSIALSGRSGVRSLLLVCCVVVVAAGVTVSGSRAAWGAGLLATALVGWSHGRLRSGLLGFVATLIASFVVLAPGSTSAPNRLLQPGAWVNDSRLTQWHAAASLFAEAPLLGHGPHSFQRLCAERRSDRKSVFGRIDLKQAPYPHNIYLEALVGTGVVGLAVLLALLALPPRWIRGESEPAGRAAAASLVVFAAVGLVDMSLTKDWVQLCLGLPLGVAAGLHARKSGPAS
jgi:O-antigen ligase